MRKLIHVFLFLREELNMKVNYVIYNPAGNITAIVLGDKYSKEEKKKINDEIMKKENEVEQVGFISNKEFKLTMAGGEFCGNATRCAIKYYLKEKGKNIAIKASGTTKILTGGIYKDNIWVEMPMNKKIDKISENTYIAKMDGITHILIKNEIPNRERAIKIINKYKGDDKAVGCVFIKEYEKGIKIDPFVWVKDIDTLFYEKSCGSGTACAGMIYLSGKIKQIKVLQPSGEVIEVFLNDKGNICILGKINTDNLIKKIEI